MQEKSYSKKSYSDNTLEEESINLLEWDTLKKQLSSFASTNMGKKAILDFEIPTEYEISSSLLRETIEINDLEKNLDKSISFSGVFDISKNVEICSKGGVITSYDLLEIAETITAERDLKNSGVKVAPIHNHRDGTASFYMQDTEGNWLEMLYVPEGGIKSNI